MLGVANITQRDYRRVEGFMGGPHAGPAHLCNHLPRFARDDCSQQAELISSGMAVNTAAGET